MCLATRRAELRLQRAGRAPLEHLPPPLSLDVFEVGAEGIEFLLLLANQLERRSMPRAESRRVRDLSLLLLEQRTQLFHAPGERGHVVEQRGAPALELVQLCVEGGDLAGALPLLRTAPLRLRSRPAAQRGPRVAGRGGRGRGGEEPVRAEAGQSGTARRGLPRRGETARAACARTCAAPRPQAERRTGSRESQTPTWGRAGRR